MTITDESKVVKIYVSMHIGLQIRWGYIHGKNEKNAWLQYVKYGSMNEWYHVNRDFLFK